MNKKTVRQALLDAVDLANGVPDPYKPSAFRVAAQALLARAEAPTEPIAAASQATGSSEPRTATGQAINEILAVFRNRSHTDKFEAIIYHALNEDGIETLSVDQILAAYAAGRLARPTNPSDILAKCSRRGHIADGPRRDGQKTWRLTGTGQRYVEQLLSDVAGEQ